MRFRGYSNVALAVLSGQTDAGAVKNEVYEDFARLGLRSLTRLPEVSEHLFVTRADMPPAEIERLRELLLNLAQVPGGLEVLKAIHRDATALVPVSDRDYDNLRALLQKIDESDDQQRRAQ
jgi:phosphonate transport system substrate-binding protein